ncbi:hypothetical protein LTR84_006716 [Exophiala bonariae]|uniref:Uncharacterized protein n=1 Tax=Exophiala bonariae TaxID=1690606 RepID=A0AAV9N353_9EURO|nr:hypothetical protein LTR84_006716 [Exophiala bonariae]
MLEIQSINVDQSFDRHEDGRVQGQAPELLFSEYTTIYEKHRFNILINMRTMRSFLMILSAGLVLWTLTFTFRIQSERRFSISSHSPAPGDGSVTLGAYVPPFSGAFATIPRVSELSPAQKRLTVIVAWNADQAPSYLRHFFYTIQLNSDVIDLLFINRVQKEDDPCLDFEKAGINVTWGGNVKIHCLNDKEWKRRHVDFLCSSGHGWNCTPTEYDEVAQEFETREDKKNFNWRPLRGNVFNDLLPQPTNSFWAWMDLDTFAGDFRRYPFNILSRLSLLTSTGEFPLIYLGGQLTAFNLEDEDLAAAWKNFPEMKSPEHFTKYLKGKMPESSEERYWSYGYLRSDENLPGSRLSYGVYYDLHGDDFFDGQWFKKNASETYVISGRDILLVSTNYTRKEIEGLVQLERNEPLDDLGGLGWTGGLEGSSYLVKNPDINGAEAKRLALSNTTTLNTMNNVHRGFIEDQLLRVENCSASPHWRVCFEPHSLTTAGIPALRTTLVHFKNQEPDHVLVRLEKDQRPRGYERKLLKHHLRSKAQKWYAFPPFDITEDLVLRMNFDSVEVFRMGEDRDETLFFRKQGRPSIG